jgi:hypothetical protein
LVPWKARTARSTAVLPSTSKYGRITKGHPRLTGKKIGAIHEPAELGTHRQQLHSSREYERAV